MEKKTDFLAFAFTSRGTRYKRRVTDIDAARRWAKGTYGVVRFGVFAKGDYWVLVHAESLKS